jgi:hypothetical protein
MSHSGIFRSLTTLAIGLSLEMNVGCAGHRMGIADYPNADLRAAIEERDAAAGAVAKAIGRYCSRRSDSLDANQRCLIDRHAELQFIVAMVRSHDASGTAELARQQTSAEPFIQCESDGRAMTCRRTSSALVELLARPSPDVAFARPSRSIDLPVR